MVDADQELGYAELKPSQQRAIKAFVEGHDVFVCLPTGRGKSLCYGVLPLVFERLRGSCDRSHTGTEHARQSLVIVVSPLKALMKDQVESFKKKGVHALCVAGQEDEESTTLCLA